MGMEFYNCSFIKSARKEHCCEFCRDTIQKGSSYYRESGKFDGEFFIRKMCPSCDKMLDEFCSEVDTEFDWDEVEDYILDTYCTRKKCEHYDEYSTDCKFDFDIHKCPIIQKKFNNKQEKK